MGGSGSKEAPHQPLQSVREENKPRQQEDWNAPLKDSPLPKDLQDLVDREDTWYDRLYEGTASESTDTNVRYAAYASRARTILVSAQRYVAYTSDIGESFRPVAHPYLVRGAYAVSWTYLIGDVGHEGYKAYCRQQRLLNPQGPGKVAHHATHGLTATSVAGAQTPTEELPVPHRVPAIEDFRAVMAQRAVFQGLASMGLPAFTIHSIVKYSGKAMKDIKNVKVRTWGPIGLGLAAVPALPFIFDEPVEKGVEWAFHAAFEAVGGPAAVGRAPGTDPKSKTTNKVKEL